MTQETAFEMQKQFQPLIDQGILPGETTAQKQEVAKEIEARRADVQAAFAHLKSVARD
jgi:hypothetical protein